MAIVYQHRRKDTGEIFYIGIGNNKTRAYSTGGRNVLAYFYIFIIVEEVRLRYKRYLL